MLGQDGGGGDLFYKTPNLKDIPVVIWTTSASKNDIILSRKSGAHEFLTKPSRFAEVVETMKMPTNLYSHD